GHFSNKPAAEAAGDTSYTQTPNLQAPAGTVDPADSQLGGRLVRAHGRISPRAFRTYPGDAWGNLVERGIQLAPRRTWPAVPHDPGPVAGREARGAQPHGPPGADGNADSRLGRGPP